MNALLWIIPARYRGALGTGAATGAGILLILVWLAVFVGFLALGSFSLAAWTGLSGGVTSFMMFPIAIFFPEVAFVLAIAGFWYLP